MLFVKGCTCVAHYSPQSSEVNSLELQVRCSKGRAGVSEGLGVGPWGGRRGEVSGEGSSGGTGQILGFSRSPAAGCESGCAAADHSFA